MHVAPPPPLLLHDRFSRSRPSRLSWCFGVIDIAHELVRQSNSGHLGPIFYFVVTSGRRGRPRMSHPTPLPPLPPVFCCFNNFCRIFVYPLSSSRVQVVKPGFGQTVAWPRVNLANALGFAPMQRSAGSEQNKTRRRQLAGNWPRNDSPSSRRGAPRCKLRRVKSIASAAGAPGRESP